MKRFCGWAALAVAGCIGNIGAGDEDTTSASAPLCASPVGGPWRLSVREYSATVRDLVGRDVDALTADLPSDLHQDGYDNQREALTLDVDQASGFQLAAERVAQLVISDPALRLELMGCDVTRGDRHACLAQFVTSFGRRAYRRPLEAETEVAPLVQLAEALQGEAGPGYQGMADVAAIVATILQSPEFLFRIRAGVATDAPGVRQLSGYELATQLAYLLWGTGPDETLITAAAAGELDTPDGLEIHARRLLADERAATHFEAFFSQWLDLGTIYLGVIDTAVYPEYDRALQDAMYQEVQRLLADFAWSEGQDFLGVLTAPYNYADAALAAIYDVALPGADGRVTAEGRAGLLGTAGILSMTSHPTEPSIVNRGLLVRRELLCDDIPPPPPNVPDLVPDPDLSAAELLNQHTADPACAACHRMIDPIGNGLEMYDALGARRTSPSQAEIMALPRYIDGVEDSEFYGGIELGQLLAELDQVRACVADNVFRWSHGRTADTSEPGCGAAPLARRLSGAGFAELLVEVVRSDEFRFITVDPCP